MIDITGQHFGRLTAIKRAHKAKNGEYAWLCHCSCGNETTVALNSLKKGLTKSCGCLQREKASILHKEIAKSYKGPGHPSWRGGITAKHWGLRNAVHAAFEYRQWRSDVFHRDNFTCQGCGKHGGTLHAHHKKRFQVIIDEYKITTVEQALECAELWDINNGITLCVDCHKKRHKVRRDV